MVAHRDGIYYVQGPKHAKRDGRTTTASWLITAGLAAMVLGPLAAPGVALDCGPQPVAMPNPDNYVSNEKADAEAALNNILDGGSPPDYLGSASSRAGNEASECINSLALESNLEQVLGATPSSLEECAKGFALPVTPVKHANGGQWGRQLGLWRGAYVPIPGPGRQPDGWKDLDEV